MSVRNLARRSFLAISCGAGLVALGQRLMGEGGLDSGKSGGLRVAKKNDPPIDRNRPPHPLDECLAIAEEALERIRREIVDYRCVLVKRERVNGTLGDQEFMFAKIRNRKEIGDRIETPFAIYLHFAKPANIKGRECLYVEQHNDGKMLAHEGGGLRVLPSVWLDPKGPIAMRGNLYPITDAGIENLIVKLLEKGNRDRKRDECIVTFRENAKINGRACRIMEVVHPIRRPHFDFNLAQVYIDKEFGLPIRYAAYTWPRGQEQNAEPKPSDSELIEEYTYMKLELNPGFGPIDFDARNPEYNFGKS
jgi:hypothetical protein